MPKDKKPEPTTTAPDPKGHGHVSSTARTVVSEVPAALAASPLASSRTEGKTAGPDVKRLVALARGVRDNPLMSSALREQARAALGE